MSVHWWEHKALTLTSGLASSFFIHHQTPDGRGVAPFTLALWCHLHINDVWLLPKEFYVGSQQKKLTSDNDDRTTTTSRERILVLKSLQFFLLASCTLLTLFLCILAQLTNAFFLNVETVVKQLLEHLPQSVIHHITLYKWCTVASGAPSWWHVNLGTTHLNVPRASVLHLFCRMTNYEQEQNPGAVCMKRS